MTVEANLSTVTALAYDSRGSLWAGTPGGLLEWPSMGQGGVKHWTRADGLPGLRVRSLALEKGVLVVTAEGSAKFTSKGFVSCPLPSRKPGWTAKETEGLPGSPISRCDHQGKSVWAVPESGLWTLVKGKGFPFNPPLPTAQVSAVAGGPSGLAAGTAAQGAFVLKGSQWELLPLPSQRLKGPDATGLIMGPGGLFIAPREGAAFRSSGQKAQAQGAPWRQSVEWKGHTVVRKADGRLMTIDQAGAEAPLPIKLPRVNATSLFVHQETLFVTQPGGWSEFAPSGGASHHFEVPGLAGCPTTSVLADAENVWIGTQNNGLFQIDRAKGEVKHYHEAHGLTDDWVTCLAKDSEGRLLVGTYVGGLVVHEGGRFAQAGLKGGFVTRLLSDLDRVWVGSLTGIWQWQDGRVTQPAWAARIEPDVSDLAVEEGALLIASGGALHRVINP